MRWWILILSVLFYTLFSLDPTLEPVNAWLFNNDLSDSDVINWLFKELCLYCFVTFIGCYGIHTSVTKQGKLVFMGVVADGIISMVRFIIFGYFEPSYISVLANVIPLSIIIYALYVGEND